MDQLEQMVPTSETPNPNEETPQTREMRRLVNAMNMDRTSELYYNPQEDEKILKEIRERVSQISTSTPYLDELKAAELQAKTDEKQAQTQAEATTEVAAGIATETNSAG